MLRQRGFFFLFFPGDPAAGNESVKARTVWVLRGHCDEFLTENIYLKGGKLIRKMSHTLADAQLSYRYYIIASHTK
jgi:hypothetical protein